MTTNTGLRMRALGLLTSVALLAPAAWPQGLAVKAKSILLPNGVVHDGVLLVEGGHIKAVGKGLSVPKGWRVVDHGDATIAPGLIDLSSVATAPRDLEEEADPVDVRSNVAHVVGVGHRDFGLLAASGVTAAVILPGDKNVVDGLGCVIKTDGKRTLIEGPLKLALGRSVHSDKRFPTSFMGALELLRSSLAGARKEGARGVLADFVRGKKRGVLHATDEASLRAALRLAREFELDLSLLEATEIRRTLAELRGSGLRVAIPALDLGSPVGDLMLPRLLHEAGLAVAFYAETPTQSAESLRVSAALATRYGLPRPQAVAAITAVPAAVAQVESRIGSLAPGRDADFIVLGGDLLDLSAPLLETWIQGRRVHAARPVAVKE